MTASARRTVIVAMAALGVAVMLVWATLTGPSQVIGSRPTPTDATSVLAPDGVDRQVRSDSDDQTPASERRDGLAWIADLVTAVGLIGALWLIAMLLRAVALRFAAYLPEKQLVLELQTLPDAELGREAMTRDQERHRAALAGSDVRNGIVACWVLLEEAASEAGVSRLPAETATEFVVRFLHTLDVDPRPVAELAGLYHEARFSTHPLAADARSRAEAALDGIHADLSHRSPG